MNDAAWAVVSTKPNAEQAAEQAVVSLGYEAWLPLYRKRLPCHRMEGTRRVRSRIGGVVLRPLIPTYLFVLLPWGDGGYEINNTLPGVRKIIRHPEGSDLWGKPKIMRARIMVQWRETVDAGSFDEIRDVNKLGLKAGDTVRTIGGFVGNLLSLDENGRYELFTQMLGTERIVRGSDAATLELVAS